MSNTETTSAEIARPEDVADVIEGLEDFDPNQGVIPILKVDHDEGIIEDANSGQTWTQLDVIILGFIRQRVLWPAEVSDTKELPLCRAYEGKVGRPPVPSRFPWEAAGFANPGVNDDDEDAVAGIALPCESCKLKDWETHPTRKIPWCAEQHTYAVLRPVGEDSFAPALLTFQRSSLKASNTYLSSFQQSKTPLYSCITRIELESKKKGNVNYVTPKFIRGDDTDKDDWPGFSNQYQGIRSFVQTPRVRRSDDASDPTNPGGSGEAAQPQAQQAQQAAPSGTDSQASTSTDTDDLPF